MAIELYLLEEPLARMAPLVDILRRRPEGSPAVGTGRAMEMTRGGGSELAGARTSAEAVRAALARMSHGPNGEVAHANEVMTTR